MVLKKLHQEEILVNLKKCSSMKIELVYIGFVIYLEGLKMELKKVKVIKEWPSPKNVYEVQSFRVLSSFYMTFIKNFSHICVPIIKTIK